MSSFLLYAAISFSSFPCKSACRDLKPALISVSRHVLILSDWLSSALPQNKTVALTKIKADMMDYLSAAAFKSLHADFHKKQFDFWRGRTDGGFPSSQEVSPVFTPFLVFVLLHVNQFQSERVVWQTDTPPAPWTGLNQPENVDNVDSAWLQGDDHRSGL